MELKELNTVYIQSFANLGINDINLEKEYWSSFLESKLRSHGAVLLRGINLVNSSEFEKLISLLSPKNSWFEYQQRATPRTALGGNVFTSTEYPNHLSIFAHNECANQTSWPAKLYFYCKEAAIAGGATPLTDMRSVTAQIPAHMRQAFQEKGILYLRSIGGKLGVSLDYAFGTQDKDEIEDYCEQEKIAVRWRSESSLEMRFTRPSFRSHPESGEQLWFNHLMFYSLVSLDPSLRENVRRVPPKLRAYHARYGDDTDVAEADLEFLRDLYDRTTVRFPWEKGDLLVVDNMLWAHGRDPYEGDRNLWVALAEPITPELNS